MAGVAWGLAWRTRYRSPGQAGDIPTTWTCLEELGGMWGVHTERRGQSRGSAPDQRVTLSSVGH